MGGIEPGSLDFSIADVVSASITFGDGTLIETELTSFSMLTVNSNINSLLYEFDPITTATVTDGPVLNFPLTITGTDIATGLAFEYVYANSTQTLTLTAVPLPAALPLFLSTLAGLGLMGWRRVA